MSEDSIYKAVYGEVYQSSETQLELLEQSIAQQANVGFNSTQECAAWAKEHLLDMTLLGKVQKKFYHLSHRGEVLNETDWTKYYGEDILFTMTQGEKPKKETWMPGGFVCYNNARIIGEQSDGIRKPLYHRDYFTAHGFFDPARDTFNYAYPFPVFAKETGADTSHIYTYLQHIAGECFPYLLAWLRHKMCYPTVKTQVIPMLISRAQGTGKTTFAEVICKGLFGEQNVIVSNQHDVMARFNADSADALIVCYEEKDENDKRNSAAALKSSATATTVRKELKGVDPIYQEHYTDFILTTNQDVPIQIETDERQRRFMIMEADKNFTRDKSKLANEIFTKLYGTDEDGIPVGIPFVKDIPTKQQFMHELYNKRHMGDVNVRKFPETPAYKRCFSLPRTNEQVEIVAIIRALAPFIQESLGQEKLVTEYLDNNTGDTFYLKDILFNLGGIRYMPATTLLPSYIAINIPVVFYAQDTGKPFAHATVERQAIGCNNWLADEFDLNISYDTSPLKSAFTNVVSRHRYANAFRFMRVDKKTDYETFAFDTCNDEIPIRIGERLRVNGQWQPDLLGEFETVNEMKPGTTTLANKNKNVQYLDTFVFEADEVNARTYAIEEERVNQGERDAETVFFERLHTQEQEALRVFNEGKACRIVYSGGKSYHILVRIQDMPKTLEEYKWCHGYLSQRLSSTLIFDPTTADPARLTRAPITFRRIFKAHGESLFGQQRLLCENFSHIWNVKWRVVYEQWLTRPLISAESKAGRRLMPTKQIYIDAMNAMLTGSFFINKLMNGQRQFLFFPAYRLCRYLGYTHEQLWAADGILEDLDLYYKPTEIEYWRSREWCDLIRQIDKDMDEYEAELKAKAEADDDQRDIL